MRSGHSPIESISSVTARFFNGSKPIIWIHGQENTQPVPDARNTDEKIEIPILGHYSDTP